MCSEMHEPPDETQMECAFFEPLGVEGAVLGDHVIR
jgi:hypothetical protein